MCSPRLKLTHIHNRDPDCPGLVICLPSNIEGTFILGYWSNVFSSNGASWAISVFRRKIKWMSPRNMFFCPSLESYSPIYYFSGSSYFLIMQQSFSCIHIILIGSFFYNFIFLCQGRQINLWSLRRTKSDKVAVKVSVCVALDRPRLHMNKGRLMWSLKNNTALSLQLLLSQRKRKDSGYMFNNQLQSLYMYL